MKKKPHNQTEARLLANLTRLAETLSIDDTPYLAAYPALARVVVEFHGCYGVGDLIGIDMFPPGDDARPIHPDILAELLEELMPKSKGHPVETIGKCIDDIVLGLLNHRYPGWAENKGSNGEIDISWKPGIDGRPIVKIGGTYQYRFHEIREHPFWSDDDITWPTGDAITAGKELAHARC